jgi:hypothetical protein
MLPRNELSYVADLLNGEVLQPKDADHLPFAIVAIACKSTKNQGAIAGSLVIPTNGPFRAFRLAGGEK